MYNKVILLGNLTKDLDLRYSPSGTAIASSSIAVNRKFASSSGEKKEEVCFIDVNFFARTAEIANQYLKKGSKILIEGRLKFDQWTDQNGINRSKHSIVVENMQMLDKKEDYNSSYNSQNNYNNSYYSDNEPMIKTKNNAPETPLDTSPITEKEDLPF